MISHVIYIIFLVFFCYAVFCTGYLLVLGLAGRFLYRSRIRPAEPATRIAILVPSYKEDGIIVSTAEHLLQVDYPSHLYDVYIIADSLKKETVARLRELPITVVEVSFEKSTKSRSLYATFRQIDKEYDMAMICDADNILGRNVLKKVNDAWQSGFKAIQARRVAKNLDSPFAILDACSEAINNNLFRKGPDALGGSSSVIGSGMAFEYDLIKGIFEHIQSLGGTITHEDKILQLKVVEKMPIHYLEEALVFDEKVDNPEVFGQQRRRWISGQFIYLKQFFIPACKQLFRGNLNYFNLAVTNNLVLPRAFLLTFLFLLSVAGFFVSLTWGLLATGLFVIYLITLFISIPPELMGKDFWAAILKIPSAIGAMFGALRGMKKANETFINTVHTKTEVSNSLFSDKESK